MSWADMCRGCARLWAQQRSLAYQHPGSCACARSARLRPRAAPARARLCRSAHCHQHRCCITYLSRNFISDHCSTMLKLRIYCIGSQSAH